MRSETESAEERNVVTERSSFDSKFGGGVWLKRIGLGVLIWVIMFAWVSILMFVFKLEPGWLLYLLTWLGAVVTVWFVAGAANLKGLGDAFLVGLIFVLVGLFLDWLVTSKFNSEILSQWSLWVGYAITLLIPVLRASMNK